MIPVITNTVPASSVPGPGENQIAAAIEPFIDHAARQLGLDPVEIRRINAPDKDGKIGPDRQPLTSAYLRDALDLGAELFKWEEKKSSSAVAAAAR